MTLSSLYAGMTMDTAVVWAASGKASWEDFSGDIPPNLASTGFFQPGGGRWPGYELVNIGQKVKGPADDPAEPFPDSCRGQPSCVLAAGGLVRAVVAACGDVPDGRLCVGGNPGRCVLGVLGDVLRRVLGGLRGVFTGPSKVR